MTKGVCHVADTLRFYAYYPETENTTNIPEIITIIPPAI